MRFADYFDWFLLLVGVSTTFITGAIPGQFAVVLIIFEYLQISVVLMIVYEQAIRVLLGAQRDYMAASLNFDAFYLSFAPIVGAYWLLSALAFVMTYICVRFYQFLC